MIYPSALDYNSAILAPDKFMLDPVLRSALPVLCKGPFVEPYKFSGGYAEVYKFRDAHGKVYAFRCWTRDIGDTAEIYRAIQEYLKPLNAPCFIDFQFFPQAVLVNGVKYPGIRMDWSDADSLQIFAHKNLRAPGLLESCMAAFLNVTRFLHSVHVAHGDLQGDNVKVHCVNGKVEILLIDYDTIYVPTLLHRPSVSSGLPDYQHPNRANSKTITEKDDYFSELVIYLALIALTRSKSIREKFSKVTPDKEFLFAANDFRNTDQSPLIRELRRSGDWEINALTEALIEACQKRAIDQLSPLEEIVELVRNRRGVGESIFDRWTDRSPASSPDPDESEDIGHTESVAEPSVFERSKSHNADDLNTASSEQLISHRGGWMALACVAALTSALLLIWGPFHSSSKQLGLTTEQQPPSYFWMLRRNEKGSHACSIQLASNELQRGAFLAGFPTRGAACQEAKERYSDNWDDHIKCPLYTSRTTQACNEEGIDLREVSKALNE